MVKGFALFCLVCTLASAGSAGGATLYVPDNHATIQGALAAATSGDTVVVRPGTYVENIDFLGKALLLIGEKGPVLTWIDGNQAGPVVSVQNGEGTDSILDGFTITNGHSSDGGGIFCLNSSPTIRNNRIHGNSVTGGSGGGIFGSGSRMVITGNEIFGNSGAYGGGGIYCHRSDAVVTNNVVRDNSGCNSYGGGIYCYWCDPVIEGNVVAGNRTARWGGGIFLDISSADVRCNIVIGNTATLGGGIDCYDQCDSRITNNTIVANSASDGGGGFHCHRTCAITMVNTILWDNDAPVGPEIFVGDPATPCTLSVSYSDVQGGAAAAHVETGCTLTFGAAMIDADPRFAEAAAGDMHLLEASPCLDAGDGTVAGLPAVDFEGDPRTAQQGVDIGADERHHHLYVAGTPSPGATLALRVIGTAGAPVRLLLGSGILDPPRPTIYGDLHLPTPFLGNWALGTIGTGGLRSFTATLPAAWVPGDVRPFQAWIGAWGGSPALLTNLLPLTVVE